jgi:sulfite oxidase
VGNHGPVPATQAAPSASTVTVASWSAEVVARAWDSAAATQPEDPAQLWNPKGHANNSWARLRLRVR